MAYKSLHPAGIISAEMARACKPNREIFEKALEIAGVCSDQAVLVGDSITSDLEAAKAVGILPILIDRSGKTNVNDVKVIRSLDEWDF